MNTTRKTFEKYQRLIKGRTWSKEEINGFKKLINAKARGWLESQESKDLVGKLEALLDEKLVYGKRGEYSITSGQTRQGIEYLKNYIFKENGQVRNRKHMPFTERQIEIVRTFRRFSFVGFVDIGYLRSQGSQYGPHSWYLPRYRVYGKGGHFDYTCGHWEDPEVITEDPYGYDRIQTAGAPSKITSPEGLFKVPALDKHEIPERFTEVECLFCDSSGLGSELEPALTPDKAKGRVATLLNEHGTLFGAITGQGQFQVYVSIYKLGNAKGGLK